MSDHYAILGVTRTANADEIKRAYRRLASQHHPDKGGDTQKFQEIQIAYDTLSDPGKRQQYDNPGMRVNMGGGNPFNFDSIFDMFNARPGMDPNAQHRSARLNLWIHMEDVASGGPRLIAVGTHQGQINVEIQIPPGIEDGDTVRYARVGPNGMDLVITFRIHPDLTWRREGANSIRKFDISIWALILGQEITVDTIHKNQVVVSVPPKTQPGATLRIRGHGFPRKGTSQRGDLMVELNAKLPTDLTPEQIEQIRHWNSQ